MLKWKRLMMITLSTSIALTQGVPIPYLVSAMEVSSRAAVNGEVNFSWTTADQVTVGSTFNPYEGLKVIDADGDDVAILAQVDGEVDTTRAGIYPISYSITNIDGETFTLTRQIEVITSNSSNLENTTEESIDSSQQEDKTTDTQANKTEENSSSDAIEQQNPDNEANHTEENSSLDAIEEQAPDNEVNHTEGNSSLDVPKEQIPTDETIQENHVSSLNDVQWILSDRLTKQELIKLNVNIQTGQYEGKLSEEFKSPVSDLDEETLHQDILKLRILSSKQVEKLAITLTVRDLLGETKVLTSLNELRYEMGDQISIIPVDPEKTILVVNGITGGDISKEQEDYSDGVESEDLIHNVRFVLHETGLSSLYNEAPVIEGIEDVVVSSFESFNPKDGVKIKDDHDENLLSQLSTRVEQVDDTTQEITYQVTDSWGRTTEAIRRVTQESAMEYSNNLLIDSTTSITENIITVKGIEFSGREDTRFNIIFDPATRKIYVRNQDGRTMNSRYKDTYFVLTHYSDKGVVKNELELLGIDRSNSTKLNVLKNNGWRYSDGDYIALWHAESETKLIINGTVSDASGTDLTQGITSEFLQSSRFELNPEALKLVKNTAPTITLEDDAQPEIIVKRGEQAIILEGLRISDDHDGVENLAIKLSNFSTDTPGTYDVTITVIDTWGASIEYIRKLIVEPKNDIDEIEIDVKNQSGKVIFTLGFDELTRKLNVKAQSDEPIDPDNSSEVLVIGIYSKIGKAKRVFRIKGTDTGNSAIIESIKKYVYSKDDYISIIPVNSSMISIRGNISDKPDDVDYENGNQDLDQFKNVRFQLDSDGTYRYTYNTAPTFHGVDSKTIKRGETFDPLEGVSVTDTEDGTINLSDVVVTYDQASLLQIGKNIVTYSVSDSWGRKTTINREITVVAPNNLEYYQIQLKNENQEFLTIGFNAILHNLMVANYVPNDYIGGNSLDNVFKLTLFDSDHQEKGTVSLKYEQEIDADFISQLESLAPEAGDYLKVWSPNAGNVLVSKFNLDDSEELFTFDSQDQLEHTRFEVSEDSLTAVYNKAPIIKGAEDTQVVYGNPFEKMQGITVEDEETNLNVQVTGEIDTNQLGAQTLTYTVTDSYGRTDTIVRTVTVVPVYTTNEVQYYDGNNDLLFSIGINRSATGFTVKLPESIVSSDQASTIQDHTNNRNSDVPNETLFKFTVYNEEAEVVEVLEITQQTIIDENLFEGIKKINVKPGFRFSVEANDLTNLKIMGSLEKPENLNDIDYSNLTAANEDAVKNVRFELTENIVGVIYNQAPIITIEPTSSGGQIADSTLIIRNKALTKEEYNLFDGVKVTDDKDELTLSVDDVTVDEKMLVSDLNESVATIGQTYTVTYQITDSWGRQSDRVERQVQIKSAMDDLHILFVHAASGFVPDLVNQRAATITFDMSAGTINVNKEHNKFKYADGTQYGAFSITKHTDSLDNPTFKYVLGGTNEYESNTEFKDAPRSNDVDRFKSALESVNIKYGDKIKIKIYQAPFLYIYGSVMDAQEDYPKGATLGAVLRNSYFVVTPEGLKQEYSGAETNQYGYSEFDWYSGVAGNRSFEVHLDTSNPDQLKLGAVAHDTEWISTLDHSPTIVFTLALYNADGSKRIGGEYHGRHRPLDLALLYENQLVTVGDYFVIKPSDKYLNNFKLYSIKEQVYFPTDVDYATNIADRTYFDNVRFYVSKIGFVPVYNEGPVFHGVDDVDILVGDLFSARGGVTVTDEIDGSIDNYTVSQETIDTSKVGRYTITYTATDSWGRETIHERVINVRPKLFGNKIQVFEADRTDNPAFEIIFDNTKAVSSGVISKTTILGALTVKSYSNVALDLSLATEDVFKIWIMDASGNSKAQATLQGRDAGNSSKLNVLNMTTYEEGDVIKVWRHPALDANGNDKIETLRITGTVIDDAQQVIDYSTGIEDVETMNNTIFKISNNGLISEYNAAPTFEGLVDKVLYYGDVFKPLDGVTVKDDKGSITLTESDVKHNVDTQRAGTYSATYTVTDSWGRTTSQTIQVKVLSKVIQNIINIYSDEQTKAFSIGFNEEANRLILTPVSVMGNSINSSFEMKLMIYNRLGSKKLDISINDADSSETVTKKLEELTKISIANNDMISVSHTNPKLIKITGTVVNHTENYENGFSSTEAMKKVRFKVTNNGLTEIQAQSFSIDIANPDTPLVIKRGDVYDLNQGVTVNHPNEIIAQNQITIEGFDLSRVGEQMITYKVTDSWGTVATATRKVNVQEKNELEKNKIHLMDTTGQSKKFTLGFDALEMKLTADIPSKSFFARLFRTLPTDQMVFEVNVYNQNQENESSFSLTSADLTNSSEVITQINNQVVDYGYYIEIRSYNYKTGLRFDGKITMDDPQRTDFTQMSKEDFITNARFELTEDGLVALYNEAPSIKGVKDFDLYIGGEQDIRENLTVSDDHDDLTYEDIEMTSDLDFYEIGEYEVTYTVTDSWGRSSSQKAKVWILSELQKNVITLKSKENSADDDAWMMKLGFDSKSQTLDLQFNETYTGQVDFNHRDRQVMLLTIFDETGKSQGSISIQGSDTVEKLKEKFQFFINQYQYHYGHFINIDILYEETNNIIIDNLIILSEDIPKNAYQESLDTEKDYFTNVRFELDPYGLYPIYNHAPTISKTDGDLTAVKSRYIEDYDLFNSIKVTDDDEYDVDLDPEEAIKVYYNKDKYPNDPENPDNLKLGENTITYVAIDTWGRESEPVTRTLTLTSGMNEITLDFRQIYEVAGANDRSALKMTFDMENGTIHFENTSLNAASYRDRFKLNDYAAHTFEIFNSDGTRIYDVIYGQRGGLPSDINNSINYMRPVVSDAIKFFQAQFIDKGYRLEYGMKIRIRSFQAPFVFIDGPVINAQEDYSTGAQLNDILNESMFVITEEGLEQEYTESITTNEKENIISWYSGIAGSRQFDLKVDPDSGMFVVEDLNPAGEPLDTHYKSQEVFVFTLFSADGSQKLKYTFTGDQSSRNVYSNLNNKPFEIGDYLEIELAERRRSNLRIYGDVVQEDAESKIDYSQELEDISYYNEARFYITEDGLSLDYNESPIFSGIEDVTLFKDEVFSLRENVTVSDDNTKNITYKITERTDVTSDNFDSIQDMGENFNTSNVGAHQINYIAKDSRGRLTLEPRFIWVYARSEISIPDESKLIVQEADPNLRTEEAVYQYLIDMVRVTDEEDDKAAGGVGQGIEVTKDNIETNFNPMQPGEYPVTYTVTDSDGNVSSATFTITVVHSINVTVPRNNIPFQVVTNLLGDDTEGKEFISGTVKLQNNYVTDVAVSVKSLTVSSDQSSTRNGVFELVNPDGIDWDNLSEEQTMTTMSLGLYAKSGLTGRSIPTIESPIWLTPDMSGNFIGVLPKRENTTSSQPTEAVLGFTAKYGKNFTSGKHNMKFTLVLEFE